MVFGRVARVDLSRRGVDFEEVDPEVVRDFMGGRGLSSKTLADEVSPRVDPLSEKNKLIFATGPATGSLLCGRHTVGGKSPLTGTISFSSAGECFGPELRRAGFDLLILEGKAEDWTYLRIEDGGVFFHDARKLRGMKTHHTERAVKEELRDHRFSIASIGPAGENLVRFAAIVNDRYGVAARGGLGALMGSKRLKAIAVRGDGEIPFARPGALEGLRERLRQRVFQDPALRPEVFGKYGTSNLVADANRLGLYPVRNFQEGCLPSRAPFHEVLFKDKWVVAENLSCDYLRCKKLCELRGDYVGRPEYETVFALGGLVGFDVAEAPAEVLEANHLCNAFGMDAISAGGAIAFLMECFQRGLLKPAETDGLDLRWGNYPAVKQLIERIALRQGIGDVLALGVKGAAEALGRDSADLAMHGKGLELPGYDPRGAFGMGLGYATGNRGGCHLEAYMVRLEAWAKDIEDWEHDIDRYDASEAKARAVMEMQNWACAYNSIGLCSFPFEGFAWKEPELASLFECSTGLPMEAEAVTQVGERIFNLERLFNLREGFSRVHDTIPRRFLEEPLKDGASRGRVVPLADLLRSYYKQRGWDEEGRPEAGKLGELGLSRYGTFPKGPSL